MKNRPGYEKYLEKFSHVDIKDTVALKYKSLEEMASKIKEGNLSQKILQHIKSDLKKNGDVYDTVWPHVKTYLVPSPVVKDVITFLNRKGKNVADPNGQIGLINWKTWRKDWFFLIYGDGDEVWLGTFNNESPLQLLKKWISFYGSQELKELEKDINVKDSNEHMDFDKYDAELKKIITKSIKTGFSVANLGKLMYLNIFDKEMMDIVGRRYLDDYKKSKADFILNSFKKAGVNIIYKEGVVRLKDDYLLEFSKKDYKYIAIDEGVFPSVLMTSNLNVAKEYVRYLYKKELITLDELVTIGFEF